MSASALMRLSGLALILAVPLWIVGELIHPRSEGLADIVGSFQSVSHAILAAAWALVLLGLPGLYAGHAGRSGALGLIGCVFMVLFAAYHVYMLLYEAGPVAALSGDPAAVRLFAPGGLVEQGTLRAWIAAPVSIAPIIYGIVLLRAGVYSRWAGWLVIAFLPTFLALAVLLTILPPAGRETLFDLRFATIGIGGSYLLLHLGLAIAGYQLWGTERPAPGAALRPA